MQSWEQDCKAALIREAARGSEFYTKEEKKLREVECKVKRYNNKVIKMKAQSDKWAQIKK